MSVQALTDKLTVSECLHLIWNVSPMFQILGTVSVRRVSCLGFAPTLTIDTTPADGVNC
jgi:hypothetical protein